MTITARFAGRCSTCGGAIHAGQQIEWVKGQPSRHTACPSGQRAATPTTTARPAASAGAAGPTERQRTFLAQLLRRVASVEMFDSMSGSGRAHAARLRQAADAATTSAAMSRVIDEARRMLDDEM